ncbi:FAD:protein FMN transferase [Candidatus Uhrbacteria bacterium]|nr:FAD:protein FMN transferase [Candidatus Uhrbacteria bacterium]
MNPVIFSFTAMGTVWKITLWDHATPEMERIIIRQIRLFEDTYSRFIKTSWLSSLTDRIGVVEIPRDFFEILVVYKKLYTLSEKKCTPLIGSVLQDLGYDREYSLIAQKNISEPPDFDKAVFIIDERSIELKEKVSFDIGAVGKGYAIDMLSHFLRARGCERFLVDGSGDLFYSGTGEEIRVGLEDPKDFEKAIGVVSVTDGAICGSGGNRRAWGVYYHIVDPYSLNSPKNILATWVRADRALLADGLATCLFLCDPENFCKDFSFEYCILYDDYTIQRSEGFLVELY